VSFCLRRFRCNVEVCFFLCCRQRKVAKIPQPKPRRIRASPRLWQRCMRPAWRA
jgi:hypothetical protein